MKRTKIADRQLPNYTNGEEVMNMVTHIIGACFSLVALVLCVYKSILTHKAISTLGSIVYGISMVTVYTISSVYHGLPPGTGKKILQVVDHCTIYLLIAGTYTPILLNAFIPQYPVIGYGLLILQWSLAIVATVLTAIDLKSYKAFSMFCYIFMGWSVIFFVPQAIEVLGSSGFSLILWGGIAYTVGAILFGIGAKIHWIHSVFHIFVILGSVLHFVGILLFIL